MSTSKRLHPPKNNAQFATPLGYYSAIKSHGLGQILEHSKFLFGVDFLKFGALQIFACKREVLLVSLFFSKNSKFHKKACFYLCGSKLFHNFATAKSAIGRRGHDIDGKNRTLTRRFLCSLKFSQNLNLSIKER